MIPSSESVVLFDGYCNLCSGSVRFIMKRDPRKRFAFVPLQKADSLNIDSLPAYLEKNNKTIILIEDSGIYTKSTAALRIARKLRFPWNLAWVLIIVPRFIRDALYLLVSKNRFKWFGRREQCFLPDSK